MIETCLTCLSFCIILVYLAINWLPLIPKGFYYLTKLFYHLITESLFAILTEWLPIFGGTYKEKLLLIPNADEKPPRRWWTSIYVSNKYNGFYEISENAIFRHLWSTHSTKLIEEFKSVGSSIFFTEEIFQMLGYLKDVKKDFKITELEIYQCTMNSLLDQLGIYHYFIAFKTIGETSGESNEEYWWSLEKNTEYVVLQRSQNKCAVINRLYRKDRQNVRSISDKSIKGKGTMSDLLAILWAHNVITEKYHVVKASCQTFVQFIEKANNQSFVHFVSKRITEYEPILPYSSPLPQNDKQWEPVIDLLTKVPHWIPLFVIVYLGDPVLLENLCSSTNKYNIDINIIQYETTLLKLATILSRKEIVRCLLQMKNLKLTPKKTTNKNQQLLSREYEEEYWETHWKNMKELHVAAVYVKDPEIIDLLLSKNVGINNVDLFGRTALHTAAAVSNVIAVKHFIAKGANPNVFDKKNFSPLHVAAAQSENTEIIDLILTAKNSIERDKGIDSSAEGINQTALHCAAFTSNVTTARHLMDKGADPNRSNSSGLTPLQIAALNAKEIDIINLFLNKKKVYKELKEKGGDKVYDCALENKNGLKHEIINRLNNKSIVRKDTIPANYIKQLKKESVNIQTNMA